MAASSDQRPQRTRAVEPDVPVALYVACGAAAAVGLALCVLAMGWAIVAGGGHGAPVPLGLGGFGLILAARTLLWLSGAIASEL
jgi:hypothetical protein